MEFNRDGTPSRGHIVGRLKSNNNKRFLANNSDASTLRQMVDSGAEVVGKIGWVWQDEKKKGRGLFAFADPARL